MESELYLRHVLEEKGFMIGFDMDGAPRKGRLIRSDRLDLIIELDSKQRSEREI